MKQIFLLSLTIINAISLLAQNNQRQGFYTIHDSVKATGFITDVIIVNKKDAKRMGVLINVNNQFFLGLSKNKKKTEILQSFNQYRHLAVTPKGIPYNWEDNKTYKLLVLMAGDSASNTSIVSGYLYLPDENKWKLVNQKFLNHFITYIVFLQKVPTIKKLQQPSATAGCYAATIPGRH